MKAGLSSRPPMTGRLGMTGLERPYVGLNGPCKYWKLVFELGLDSGSDGKRVLLIIGLGDAESFQGRLRPSECAGKVYGGPDNKEGD